MAPLLDGLIFLPWGRARGTYLSLGVQENMRMRVWTRASSNLESVARRIRILHCLTLVESPAMPSLRQKSDIRSAANDDSVWIRAVVEQLRRRSFSPQTTEVAVFGYPCNRAVALPGPVAAGGRHRSAAVCGRHRPPPPRRKERLVGQPSSGPHTLGIPQRCAAQGTERRRGTTERVLS